MSENKVVFDTHSKRSLCLKLFSEIQQTFLLDGLQWQEEWTPFHIA